MDELAFDIAGSVLYRDKDLMSSMAAIEGLMGEVLDRMVGGRNEGTSKRGPDVYMVCEDWG